jgi:hypothetical protein
MVPCAVRTGLTASRLAHPRPSHHPGPGGEERARPRRAEAFVLGIIGWLVALLIAIAAIVIGLLLGAYVGRSSNGHRHAIDTDTAPGPP